MVTSRDVARAAGVSQSTVSRVIRDSASVRPETRAKVVRAFAELGYTPNAMARAMKTQRTGTMGVVVANLTNPLYPEVVEALSKEIARAGRRMLLWNSGDAGERSAIDAIHERLVDGVVFTTATRDSKTGDNPLAEALRLGAPCVLVNRSVDGAPCDQVLSDNEGGAEQVVAYLAGAGHHRIAFLGGPSDASTAVEREQGFRRAAERHGMVIDPALVAYGDFDHEAGLSNARRWLRSDRPPSAIFCVNDVSAFGVLGAARELGVDVPGDLWVVGFNDIAAASWPAFDLTTVRQSYEVIARRAIEQLSARIDDPQRDVQVDRFPVELIVRGSTAHASLTTVAPNGGWSATPPPRSASPPC